MGRAKSAVVAEGYLAGVKFINKCRHDSSIDICGASSVACGDGLDYEAASGHEQSLVRVTAVTLVAWTLSSQCCV